MAYMLYLITIPTRITQTSEYISCEILIGFLLLLTSKFISDVVSLILSLALMNAYIAKLRLFYRLYHLVSICG